ncbi:hypothetical protein J0695_41250, partial [Streptomyces beijiangensis]|nr:hypothetical protein [Streptomyces beijiangensis]
PMAAFGALASPEALYGTSGSRVSLFRTAEDVGAEAGGLACAAAVATITAMEDEDIGGQAARLGSDIPCPALAELAERHPPVGEGRGPGAFWALEPLRNRET